MRESLKRFIMMMLTVEKVGDDDEVDCDEHIIILYDKKLAFNTILLSNIYITLSPLYHTL